MTENEILALKQEAAEKTGVPANLIKGETTEEIAASAFALAKFRNEYNEKADAEKRAAYENMPTRDKFAAWLNGDIPAEPAADPTPTPPAYPIVPDGGTPQNINYGPRDPRESFREWFGNVSAFDPRKDYGNW